LSLDDALALFVGQNCRIGPLPYQQSERSEEYGLTGTGLAGDSHEATAKGDIGFANQRIVFYM
jgi:hypothetical protein